MAGKNFAQFIVNTTSQEATLQLLAEYQPEWSERFPDAYVRFKRLDYLEVPELEYRFYGEDLDSLHVVAEELMAQMREMPELEWVHTDFMQPFPLVSVELDPVASAQLGISRTTASLSLAVATSDVTVGHIWERQQKRRIVSNEECIVDNEELATAQGKVPKGSAAANSTLDSGVGDYCVPIVLKDTTTLTFSDIENVAVSSAATMMSGTISGGNSSVPLRQIATVRPKWSESRIIHRGGERCLTVTAQFAQGVYAAPVEARITDMMNQLQLPQGVRCEVGGEIEYNGEMMPQIISGVAIAMIIIFFFLLFNFKKFGISTVCIMALGLMAPGALIGLGLMDRTLGLTSIMGVITLMGMIMRNEILIFEHANNLLPSAAPGASSEEINNAVRQAAYNAGKRRMVPIFLTTATTAVGVVPMIIAQSSFWTPVGVTIFAGGIGSLIMVVTMLPVVYWKTNLK